MRPEVPRALNKRKDPNETLGVGGRGSLWFGLCDIDGAGDTAGVRSEVALAGSHEGISHVAILALADGDGHWPDRFSGRARARGEPSAGDPPRALAVAAGGRIDDGRARIRRGLVLDRICFSRAYKRVDDLEWTGAGRTGVVLVGN